VWNKIYGSLEDRVMATMETSAMFVYRHGHQYDVSLPTAMSMPLISKTTEEV